MGDTEILKSILNKLDSMDTQLENLEDGQKRLEEGFGNLEGSQKRLEEGFGNLKDSQRKLEEGFGNLKDSQRKLEEGFGNLKDSQKRLEEGFGNLKDSQERLEEGFGNLKDSQRKLEEGQKRLESKVDILEKNQDTLFLNQAKLHEETQNEIRGLKAYIENDVKNNIALLAENHLNLIDKLNQNVNFTSKNSLYEFKVNMCFEKISQLEKEIADLKAVQ